MCLLTRFYGILIVLPVTTATVEWTFSSMKLIKTRLRSRMGESTLEHAMFICIEGPDQLPNDTLKAVIDYYKHAKKSENWHFKTQPLKLIIIIVVYNLCNQQFMIVMKVITGLPL